MQQLCAHQLEAASAAVPSAGVALQHRGALDAPATPLCASPPARRVWRPRAHSPRSPTTGRDDITRAPPGGGTHLGRTDAFAALLLAVEASAEANRAAPPAKRVRLDAPPAAATRRLASAWSAVVALQRKRLLAEMAPQDAAALAAARAFLSKF